jgi:hypothetical protein
MCNDLSAENVLKRPLSICYFDDDRSTDGKKNRRPIQEESVHSVCKKSPACKNEDRLYGLMVRVPGYRSRDPGFDF